MQQKAEVKRDLGNGCAEVFVMRQSACSGDCHSCGGCGAVKQTVFVKAQNLIGAKPGDRVLIESDTRSVLASVCIAYLPPILLFFAGYFAGIALGAHAGLVGALGFVLGLVPAFLRDRALKKRQTEFRITQFLQE